MPDNKSSFAAKCEQARCRSCGREGLLGVLDLGQMPLSDGLVRAEQFGQPEERFPLELAFCPECCLVQILQTVPPEKLFGQDYPYYSSFSSTLLEHSRQNALELIERRKLTARSLVVEVASNDGYLLKNFVERGIPVLGIDPAPGPVKAARTIGVDTLCEFFSSRLARRLRDEMRRADVIIANNVLAHVAETNGFVEGLAVLVEEDGVIVIECPYVRDLIEHREFDTIYHEHLCYFSVTSLDKLFRRHGLFLNDVRRLSIHGGSLRLYVQRREAVQSSVRNLLEEERRLGLDRFEYYQHFSEEVLSLRAELRSLLTKLKRGQKRIAAYGAAAKGAILLNYVGIGSDTIDFVVDRNVHKQGWFMPGVKIPIYDPARLLEDMPDYVVVLPWNFRDEILMQQQEYRRRGGSFIIPIPRPEVIAPSGMAVPAMSEQKRNSQEHGQDGHATHGQDAHATGEGAHGKAA